MQTKLSDSLDSMADQMGSLAADISPEKQASVATGKWLSCVLLISVSGQHVCCVSSIKLSYHIVTSGRPVYFSCHAS